MKKAIAMLLVLVMCLSLCGCGKSERLSGTYQRKSSLLGIDIKQTMTFSGKNVKVVIESSLEAPMTNTGTFSMDGNVVKCEWDDAGTEEFIYDAENDTLTKGDKVYKRVK